MTDVKDSFVAVHFEFSGFYSNANEGWDE